MYARGTWRNWSQGGGRRCRRGKRRRRKKNRGTATRRAMRLLVSWPGLILFCITAIINQRQPPVNFRLILDEAFMQRMMVPESVLNAKEDLTKIR
ncbi:hypothetical protein IF1G_02259 [Cordyceps javanica]|uniref:Uncharacterized protein n=1 Tax=Cordyceps javanica TaxID=43265 RepID=A0A545VEB0_9HYPO|nr:hypothetical protein IF1G_02259 [Cordyceps javanica]